MTREPVGDEPDEVTELAFSLEQNGGFGQTIGRLRLSASTEDPERLALGPFGIQLLRTTPRTAQVEAGLERFFRRWNLARRELAWLEEMLAGRKLATTPVMEELAAPRETFILTRGDHLQPGARVGPATPKSLHAWDEALPRNRLGLAKWLVDPSNPLVARATVNRWWAQLFGRGLVPTPEDFGTQGERPSHPDLLDWLAVELVSSGWSMKHVIKLMVMSATYQQSSNVTPELLERDPRNELHARAPRLRLAAEQIRDNALAISGLLAQDVGGPPVYPPQPPELWRHVGRHPPRYVTAADEDRFRRGVYVVWRRVAPHPSFVNFDAPDRTSCVVARSRTNTPLQALTLMNDEAYVEMAVALARRILALDAPDEARIAYGFRLATGRIPKPAEARVVARLLDAQRARIGARPSDAIKLVEATATYLPGRLGDERDLAAWFLVANLLLNLDETITRG